MNGTARAKRALAPLGIALLLSATGVAGAQPPPIPVHTSSPFWRELTQPGSKRVRALVRQALLQARLAFAAEGWEQACKRLSESEAGAAAPKAHTRRRLEQAARRALWRRAQLDGALARLERARVLAPNDPFVLFVLAQVLSEWEEPGPMWQCRSRRKIESAIQIFDLLRQLDPRFRAEQVSVELAVLHTKAGRFDAAVQAWARAIALLVDERQNPMWRANMAEATMMAGSLERAVAHYRRALELSSDRRDALLAGWGLVVALDRLGEHEVAIERAAALGHMQVLRSAGVFFEPAAEIHYYEALGHEARAGAKGAKGRGSLQAALRSWTRYLAMSAQDDPFGPSAARNLKRVRQMLEAASAR